MKVLRLIVLPLAVSVSAAFASEMILPVCNEQTSVAYGLGRFESDLPIFVMAGEQLGLLRIVDSGNYFFNGRTPERTRLINGTTVSYDPVTGRQSLGQYTVPGPVNVEIQFVQYAVNDEVKGLEIEQLSIGLSPVGSKVSYLIEVSCPNEGIKCGLDATGEAEKVLGQVCRIESL